MPKIGFFLANEKGLNVISAFIEKIGTENIAFISSYRNKNVQKDFFHEIKDISTKYKIDFYEKNQLIEKYSDINIAIGWQWIISKQDNLIVLHDSLLPKYRGFAPLVNMLINGEKRIGVSAIFASNEYDKGSLITQKSIPISYPIKIQDAISLISKLYIECVLDVYHMLKTDTKLVATNQDESVASYSPWLNDDDYFINWMQDSDKIKRFIDATGYPYDGAKTICKNETLRFIDAESIADVFVEDRERHIGKVLFFKEDCPVVICKTGLLKINEITDEFGISKKISLRTRFK